MTRWVFAVQQAVPVLLALLTLHMYSAIGVPPEIAQGSLRLTLGDANTEEDVDYVLEVLPQVVEKLRAISPFYKPSDVCEK